MARWSDLERESPQIATEGRALLYQFGPGLAYLATRRADGGLRIHPFCPVVTDGGMYGLIADSPKRRDLASNGAFAIHAFPKPDRDDELMLSGSSVRQLSDPDEIERVAAVYHAAGATSSGDELTFEFLIDRALLSLYEPRDSGKPTWPPQYFRWQAR